jgi:hypothetical protein
MLTSPANGAVDVALETTLCWTLVDDPDGETIRYRVFVDGFELTEGRLADEPGHAGPCLGPLTFAEERTFDWHVVAFEPEHPSQESAPSESWSFTTLANGTSSVVFEDRFDVDLGWEIEGAPTQGAWVRGDPIATLDVDRVAQPGRCAGGLSCMFTGQNPDGVLDAQDVAGGSTVLLSPPFDLGGAVAATVELSRFFYRSQLAAGPQLHVELLVPDADEPGEYEAFSLEQLASPTADFAANLWMPREYAVCAAPMRDGSRLRITATDEGSEILEAGIDSVIVRAHALPTVCETGEGGICDPSLGDGACPDALSCCSQGAVNRGVYRCTQAVRSLDYDAPPPEPESPGNGPLGCAGPDLIVEDEQIDPLFIDIQVGADSCLLFEGCVDAPGPRTIMAFDLMTPNIGSDDLVLGIPANEPDLFQFSACHAHYHFEEYARYELFDEMGTFVTGHKQAFCLIDLFGWAWPNEPGTYDCTNQGISRGFADVYALDLPCQWVDVTDMAPGDYTLRVELNRAPPFNALPILHERDYANNVVEVVVTLP